MAFAVVGRSVEVLGDSEAGFGDSYALATVEEVRWGAASSIVPTVLLQYQEVRAGGAPGAGCMWQCIPREQRAQARRGALCTLQFVDDDGNPEREELCARSVRLRPAWPASSNPKALDAYEVRRQRCRLGDAFQAARRLLGLQLRSPGARAAPPARVHPRGAAPHCCMRSTASPCSPRVVLALLALAGQCAPGAQATGC